MSIGSAAKFLRLDGVRLEYVWIGPAPEDAPTLVFLHEGLGSASMWRGIPGRLVEATGCGALIYSRAGYGRSDPAVLPRPIHFMHHEAAMLSKVLAACNVRDAALVGHSDGASIALIQAGSNNAVDIRCLILEAPHVFVEPVTLTRIAQLEEIYRTTDLPQRLRRHHGTNTEDAFWGWRQVWLDPLFRDWNIESYLPAIKIPMLVIQGAQDEYGTWAQVEAIERQAGGSVESLLVPECGHVPHREQPDLVLGAITRFVRQLFG